MITLSATAGSAENAFRLLKLLMECYPQLSDYCESGYLVQNLTDLSADNLSHTGTNPLRYGILAALLVLAGGVALVVLQAMISDRIYSRAQAENLLDISMAGEISYVHKQKGQKALISMGMLTGTRTGANTGTKGSMMISMLADPTWMEDIDRLTTHIQHRMDAHHYHTLMVTSLRENEGKSTVAVNVALNLARRGKQVLLVDGDMRRPAVYRIFETEVPEGHSYSDCLSGNCTFEEAEMKMEPVDRFAVIMQKKAIAEPDLLLEDKNFSRGQEGFNVNADYIIIVTPPFGIVRDAEIIAETVDAAVLIFRQDKIRAVEINDTVDLLERAGTHVIGGVLNMVKGMRSRGSKSYGYDYGYGYGDRDSATSRHERTKGKEV